MPKDRKDGPSRGELATRSGVAQKTVSRWFTRHPWLRNAPGDVQVAFLKQTPEEKRAWLEANEREYNVPAPLGCLQAPRTAQPKDGAEVPEEEVPGFSLNLPEDFGEGRGLRREVDALSVACCVARAEFRRLAAAGHRDMGKAFSVYEKLLSQWRQIGKDAPKALAELDESASKADTLEVLLEAFGATRRLMDALPKRAALRGADLSAEKLEAILEEEIESVRSVLERSAEKVAKWLREAEQ
jgi:hypothetical protein